MTRGRRTRVECGIYRDTYGLAARVTVGRVSREKRFPPDLALEKIRQWRARTLVLLLEDHAEQRRHRADPRSLTRSMATYLRKRTGRPGARADRSHLKAWMPICGTKRRHTITSDDVDRALSAWRAAGTSPTTIRHRLRVLRELYRALDGPHVLPPIPSAPLPKAIRPAPIPVPAATIRHVAASLARGQRHPQGYGANPRLSRARFLVYATTGQRPSQIGRARPGDVDLERRIWFVRPAKGGDPIPLPLNDEMMDAWRLFIAAKAWGRFDTTGLAKVLRRHGWPAGIRPYMLRHTFAIDLLLSGKADLGDVQGLLGHASIQTTRQFYAPILVARMRKAVAGRRLNLNTVPRTGVPRVGRTRHQDTPQSTTSRAGRRTKQKGASTRKRS